MKNGGRSTSKGSDVRCPWLGLLWANTFSILVTVCKLPRCFSIGWFSLFRSKRHKQNIAHIRQHEDFVPHRLEKAQQNCASWMSKSTKIEWHRLCRVHKNRIHLIFAYNVWTKSQICGFVWNSSLENWVNLLSNDVYHVTLFASEGVSKLKLQKSKVTRRFDEKLTLFCAEKYF